MRKKLLTSGNSFRSLRFAFLGLIFTAILPGASILLQPRVSVAAASGAADYSYSSSYAEETEGGGSVFATKADMMISSAESFIKSKDYASAAKIVAEVTVKYPDYVPGWLLLGYSRSLMGDYKGSNAAYLKALELGADPTTINTRTAYNYMKLNDWENAKKSYDSILEYDENNSAALTQLGYIAVKQGDLERAAYYYKKALAIEPENQHLLYSLSSVLVKIGDEQEAVNLLEKAAELDPGNPRYLKKLSSLYLKRRAFEEALPVLQKLAELHPKDTNVHRNLGVTLYELGRRRAAVEEFEKVASYGGDLKGLHGPIAECFLKVGDSSRAMSYIRQGLKEHTQQAWLYSLWGKILEKNGDYDSAISKFRKAVNLGQEPWSAYARKQIARQKQLKKRAQMLAKQGGHTGTKKKQ